MESLVLASCSASPSLLLSAAAGRQTRAAESVRLEHQLVRVPLEALKSTACANHRLAEKEIAVVLSSASSATAAPGDNGAAAVDYLTSLVSRLHTHTPISRRIMLALEKIRTCIGTET